MSQDRSPATTSQPTIPGARTALVPGTAVIALVFVIAIAAGGAFSALVRYDLVGFGHLPRAAVFAVFLLLLINAVAVWWRRRRPFKPHSLPSSTSLSWSWRASPVSSS